MNNTTNQDEDTWRVFVLLIKEIADTKGISYRQIAERTGIERNNVYRMFQLKYCPSLQNWLKILKAVEVNIFFEDRESKTDLNILFEKAMAELGRRPDKLPKN